MSLLALQDHKQFEGAILAKLGRPRKLPPYLDQLRIWIGDTLRVNVLYVALEHVELGPAYRTPRLRVILETDREFKSWFPKSFIKIRADINRRILRQLQSIAKDHGIKKDLSQTFLIVNSFEDACLAIAGMRFHEGLARRFKRALPKLPIWKVDGFCGHNVVFLHTEQDVREAKKSRWGAQIKDWCFEGNKQYDEFNYLTKRNFRFKFDSKENLDKNYEGSLFYYWR